MELNGEAESCAIEFSEADFSQCKWRTMTVPQKCSPILMSARNVRAGKDKRHATSSRGDINPGASGSRLNVTIGAPCFSSLYRAGERSYGRLKLTWIVMKVDAFQHPAAPPPHSMPAT